MAELLELFFTMMYAVVGRVMYGKKFDDQDAVPWSVKITTWILTIFLVVGSLALFVWWKNLE